MQIDDTILQIATAVAKIQADVENIDTNVNKLNGKVAAHESRLQVIEGAQALAASTLAGIVTKNAELSKSWKKWLEKFAWALVSVVAIGGYRIFVFLVESDIIKKLIQ